MVMATFKTFEEIKAWQKARMLCNEIYAIITTTALEKDYKLKDQINGSSGSAMDNIAEGFGRGGNAEFIQFLEVTFASACECQSQLYRVADRKYITTEKFNELYKLAQDVRNMTLKLIQYLSETEMKGPKFMLRENKKKS
jgi:four helix bundle protein